MYSQGTSVKKKNLDYFKEVVVWANILHINCSYWKHITVSRVRSVISDAEASVLWCFRFQMTVSLPLPPVLVYSLPASTSTYCCFHFNRGPAEPPPESPVLTSYFMHLASNEVVPGLPWWGGSGGLGAPSSKKTVCRGSPEGTLKFGKVLVNEFCKRFAEGREHSSDFMIERVFSNLFFVKHQTLVSPKKLHPFH